MPSFRIRKFSVERFISSRAAAPFKVYAGGDHGLATTRQAEFNSDLLAFTGG